VFKHLLVPLDGSLLAESALPAAAYLAQALDASVMLVHVIERNAPPEVHGERHLTNPDEANAYLSELAQRAFPPGLRVQWHVHTAEVGNVARSIVEHIGEFAPDLLVMCSHGSGGLRDWLFGNIAQQVIALGNTPVLLIHPATGATAHSFETRLILVPLDGSPEHEQGVPVAIGLACACTASLHLLEVVPTLNTLSGNRAATGRLLPGATAAMLELAEANAVQHMRGHVAEVQSAHVTVTAEVARGEPAAAIVSVAERINASLIVLGTHGKTGMDAFWSGSVTPKVASKTNIPLLLVPVYEAITH
jgi:nucleotide-binding universal stress UspA family protein